MIRSSIAVVVLGLAHSTAPCPARAQFFPGSGASSVSSGNIEGITVTGRGSVSAKPNRMEVELEVSAASELTADAIVKYRDAKRRLHEAFAGLKLDKVAVEERGLLVDQKGLQVNPYFFDYQPNRRTKVEVELTRKLLVTCANIRDMDEEALLQLAAKLLDVAQDAGARIGGGQNDFYPYYYNPYNRARSGLVRFILDDLNKLEEDAYAKAFADAETRAKRLAKLSHVELGPISGVRVITSPTERTGPVVGGMEPDDDDPPRRKRLESPRFQEVPVRVELVVRFAIVPNQQPNERAGNR